MLKPRISLLLGALAAASALQSAPLNSFVGDDVDIYLSLRSMAESRASWEAHPFAKVIDSPEVKDFLEPLIDLQAEPEEESVTDVLEEEFGLTWDELFELLPGQAAAAWYNLPELVLEQAERPELVIMAEYAGEPEKMAALMQIQFERNAESQKEVNPAIEHTLIEESFMGETLYMDETFDGEDTYIEDGYALVDGIFILATPETRLRSAVESILDGAEAPLNENEAYLRSREEGGRGDLEVYINLEAIMPPLNAELLSNAMEGGVAMFGINEQSLNAALSLESMQAFFFDLDLVDKGLRSHSGLIYREKAGILKLLTYADEPLPEGRYVPKGVFSSSITNFDLSAMLTELETLLTTASPMVRIQIDAQLQTIRNNTGIDFRAALLENFGGEMVTLSILPEAVREGGAMMEPDQVFVVALKDAEALSGALEALKDLIPGVREQIVAKDFAGQTIHTLQAAPNPAAPDSLISYVITRSHFILSIGRAGLLQEVLTALDAGEDGFWQLAETEALFDSIVQPGAVSRSFIDLEKLMIPIFQSMVETSQLGGEATALSAERIPRDLSVPFNLISETNEAEDGLFSRALILQREDSE